jgi:hypothetical protein
MFCVKNKLILSFFFCTSASLHAQRIFYPANAFHLSSANYSQSVADPLTASSNCSLLPYLQRLAIGIFCEQRYTKEINLVQLAVSYSLNGSGMLLSLQRFGNNEFSESKLTAGYGKIFGKVKAGIQFDYIVVTTRGYPTMTMVEPAISGLFPFSQYTCISLRINNPAVTKLKEGVIPASAYSIGLGWNRSPQVYAALALEKQQHRPLAIVSTVKYQFKENLSIKLSWNTSINQPVIGLCWTYLPVIFQASFGFNSPLGSCPSASVIYKSKHRITEQ